MGSKTLFGLHQTAAFAKGGESAASHVWEGEGKGAGGEIEPPEYTPVSPAVHVMLVLGLERT